MLLMHVIKRNKSHVSLFIGQTLQVWALSAEERHTCREALKNLLGKVYQPVVIKELLILQVGPKPVCMSEQLKNNF